MEDSECFLSCLHLKLQPVHEQQCNGNVFQLQTLSRTFWHKLFGVRGDRKAIGMICATGSVAHTTALISQLRPHATGRHQLPETFAKFQQMVGTPPLQHTIYS